LPGQPNQFPGYRIGRHQSAATKAISTLADAIHLLSARGTVEQSNFFLAESQSWPTAALDRISLTL
jgi:hypothetical protein